MWPAQGIAWWSESGSACGGQRECRCGSIGQRKGNESLFITFPPLEGGVVDHAFFILCIWLRHLPDQLGLLASALLSLSCGTRMRASSSNLGYPAHGPWCDRPIPHSGAC